ncbi:MAG: metal-sulfur cluster assembly factor [Planctomycetota bacterium]
MVTIQKIRDELKRVIDPELPLNIVDLGLIRDVSLEDGDCRIEMTLTSAECPMADSIPEVVARVIGKLDGVRSVEVEVVWDPPWSTEMISPAGRAILAKASGSGPSPA